MTTTNEQVQQASAVLAAAIRQHAAEQRDLWRQARRWAKRAMAKEPDNRALRLAATAGIWPLPEEDFARHRTFVCIDLNSGAILPAKAAYRPISSGQPIDQANDSEVLLVASQLTEVDAAELLDRFKAIAARQTCPDEPPPIRPSLAAVRFGRHRRRHQSFHR